MVKKVLLSFLHIFYVTKGGSVKIINNCMLYNKRTIIDTKKQFHIYILHFVLVINVIINFVIVY